MLYVPLAFGESAYSNHSLGGYETEAKEHWNGRKLGDAEILR